ncbi:assimilatory sulfite reductase (NADPH) flavoprotein subunit [Novilysobacter erysipheiresistens]|uniref:Sulfite reductase [NADPH] flavoprotein alpha-component n=1 Tax=Novilysobacter erysipheiresistens TaxID=1749332 RepID=A0ABU7YVN6_9GAMM
MSANAVAAAVPSTPPTPLSRDQADLLHRLTERLDGAGLWWLSGYAAGLARGQVALVGAATDTAAAPPVATTPPVSVVYGSQTGNAKRLAEKLARQLDAGGIPARLWRADTYPTRELKDERQLYLVISTQGDGDPPDDARALVEFIAGKRAPKLPQLRFAVLGLGDSSYPQFCSIGRQLDARLAELGATRLFERGDADLDIDSVATPWLDRALASARESQPVQAPRATVTALRPLAPAFDRATPFAAEVLANQPLTARGSTRQHSDRDVRHVELSLEGSGLHYEPGDALGVWPRNPPALVEAVLTTLALDGDAPVSHNGAERPLRQWLLDKRELTRLTRPFVGAHAALAGSAPLDRLLQPDNATDLTALLGRQQLIDLLRAYPGRWTADALVAALRPLTPRLYSIASSQKAVGEEAHLTVAHIEYAVGGETRWGAASHFLASRGDDDRVPVFIEHNERFRLPADPARDVIMIGPGTGVAPFRGFVQERSETRSMTAGASGRNWLLFGNPHFRTDFLYQAEWQQALKDGQLHRLDLAFSRDQAEKIYVQDRLREHGRELYAWLDNGAHLYVCGDATRMAKDVHAALIDVIAEHGGKSREDAETRLNDIQQQGRYARDVY